MAPPPLRLRLDPPYVGESMSSFLGRAANLHAMSTTSLLKELMAGEKWPSQGRRDLDLAPPAALERRLAESITQWRSPLEGFQGFQRWILAPRCRNAYCPKCFVEDLQAGRTPYFRLDWIPVLVTTCWQHGTPLFEWEHRDSANHCRLPKPWVYQMGCGLADAPDFFIRHLALLEGLLGEGEQDSGVPITQGWAWKAMRGLQAALEKQSGSPMPVYRHLDRYERDLASATDRLITMAACHLVGGREDPIASTVRPQALSGWFEGIPPGTHRRAWEYASDGIRQTQSLGWRRTFLLFAARTLLGSDRFKTALLPACHALPWRVWWQDLVRPVLGPEQQASLDWNSKLLEESLADPWEN